MTISTAPAPLSFDGDDNTDDFAITWKYFAKADVVATLRGTGDSETTQVLDTDFTLTAAGDDSGGTLHMNTPPATGETLVVTLEPASVQETSLPLGGALPSADVEAALDRLAQLAAKLESLLDRALTIPRTDTEVGSMELPIDANRVGFLEFDSNGDPTIAAAGTTGGTGSAGSGKQYVTLSIGGTVYKLLHDGTV